MQSLPFFRWLLGAALCTALAFPALAGDETMLIAASKGGKKQAAPAASAGDIQAQLDTFARNYIKSMNDCVKPSRKARNVSSTGKGYVATFKEYDPASLQTSFKPSANPAVQYIGYLHYDEVEYTCPGKSKSDASTGPCTPSGRDKMTELIMYVNGKWTY